MAEVDDDGSTDSLDLEGRDVRLVRDHPRFGCRAGDPAAQPGPDHDGGLAARSSGGRAVPGADRPRRRGAEALPAPAAAVGRLLSNRGWTTGCQRASGDLVTYRGPVRDRGAGK